MPSSPVRSRLSLRFNWMGPSILCSRRTLLALGRLDSVSTLLPGTGSFSTRTFERSRPFLANRREPNPPYRTSSSSKWNKWPGVPVVDAQEVSNYVAAMEYGVSRLRDGFPFSARLIREIHEKLLSKVGERQGAGRISSLSKLDRRQPTGGLLYLYLLAHSSRTVRFRPREIRSFLKMMTSHTSCRQVSPWFNLRQFTPCWMRNGRVGRLLITLLFCASGILREPCFI